MATAAGEVTPQIGQSIESLSRKELEELTRELRGRVHYLRAVIDQALDLIVVIDGHGRIVDANQAAEALLGDPGKRPLTGRRVQELYRDPADAERLQEIFAARDRVLDYETRVRKRSGGWMDASVTMGRLAGAEGSDRGAVIVLKDISRRKRLEKRLKRVAATDPLTGLFNRACLHDRLFGDSSGSPARTTVRSGEDSSAPLSVVMLDLDGFKEYNDRFGHVEGDRLLARVGKILLRSLRPYVDTAYRYGGDEFVVLLPGRASDELHAWATDLCRRVAQASEGSACPVRTSLGIAFGSQGLSSRQLIREADQALYQAKRAGGNQVYPNARKSSP